jgi:hypothetical protein
MSGKKKAYLDVTFTQAEADWLRRAITKKGRLAARPAVVKRNGAKICDMFKRLAVRFQRNGGSPRVTRVEARELEKMVRAYRERLVGEVIPAYLERISKDPAKYTEYRDASVQLADVLERLNNKLSEAL